MSAENKDEKHTKVSFFEPSPVKEGKEEKIERKEEKQILVWRIEQLDWVLGHNLSVLEVQEIFRNHWFLTDDSNSINALRKKLNEIKLSLALDLDITKAEPSLKELEPDIEKITESAKKARYKLLNQIQSSSAAMFDIFRSEFFHWNLNDNKLEGLGIYSLAKLTKQVMKKTCATTNYPLMLIKPACQGNIDEPAVLSIFYPNIAEGQEEENFMEYPICVVEHGAIEVQGNSDLAGQEFYEAEELFKALRAEYPHSRILAYNIDMEVVVQSVRKEIQEAANSAFMRARFLTAFFDNSGEKRVLSPEAKAAWGAKFCDDAERLAQSENREKRKILVEEANQILRRD